MLSREDRILSELIVDRGLATPETVERRARELEDSNERDLVRALVSHGEIDPEAGRRVREEAREIDGLLRAELPEGRTLGEYRLLREIGRGGMGIVYEAEQRSLGRRVALKVLPAGAALDERLAIRFLREARTAARLQHPGIVPVFGTGRERGVLFFAMELVDGETLAGRIARGPLPAGEAASIASQIARALQHAHDAGLVHRDVKPENVMLGADGRARLGDFGLVHDLGGARLTRSQYVLGTPAYSAPEQARGAPVDPRSDIYGAGAVLYAMLAGVAPYEGEVPAAVLGRLVSGPPRPLTDVAPQVPPTLAAICARAMERDPARRFPDAGSLADALERFLAGDEPASPPAVLPAPRRGWALAALLAAAALAATPWLVLDRDGPERTSPPAARAGLLRGRLEELPTGPERKISLSMSPGGGSVAFTTEATATEPRGIWLQRVDGAEPTRLLSGNDLDSNEEFSPDGRKLAFCRAGRLSILELETGVETPSDLACGGMTWSPDGRRILLEERDWPQTRLRVVDLATGDSRLISGPGACNPSWSRDGRIAFVAVHDGQYDVWTSRDDGTDARRVTMDAARESSPVWTSPPGRLYYASNLGFLYDLWEVDLDARTGAPRAAPRRVSHGLIGAWIGLSAARERERLAFVQSSELEQCWVLPVGEDATPTAAPRILEADVPCETAVPSSVPGRDDWIASSSGDAVENLFRYTAESGLTRVTDGPYHDRSPRWSPDGGSIAFSSDRSGRSEIWSIRPDGTGLRRITESAGDARHPVWSPDGRRLAYHVDGHGAWVVPAEGGTSRRLGADAAPASFEPWSWSEGGTRLAGTAGGIVVVDPDGAAYTRVSDFGERPAWFGRGLVFTHERSVFYWDGDGAPRPVWSAGPNRITGMHVQAGRGELVFKMQSSRRPVWILDLEER